MNPNAWQSLSDELASTAERAAQSVVQVQGHRAPVTGVVFSECSVLTNGRALGRDDGLHIRRDDGAQLEAELRGWDPATGLALLEVEGLEGRPLPFSEKQPRVGEVALALARSRSNSLTASMGLVAVIGGPLRTGPGRSVETVLRTTAPMHEGFAGGAFLGTGGTLLGITTAAVIRGFTVIIPASIASAAAAELSTHGQVRRAYLGIAGQPVRLAAQQREREGREGGLLVIGVSEGSPAAKAGLLVGDVIIAVDGDPMDGPEMLLEILGAERIGSEMRIRVLRGDRAEEVVAQPGERPKR